MLINNLDFSDPLHIQQYFSFLEMYYYYYFLEIQQNSDYTLAFLDF